MKKNRMMRLASVLMVAVMMTTCTISGTFAKYTTSVTSQDTARVAAWGFGETSTISFDLFDDAYNSGKIDSVDGANVIAPGSSKTETVKLTYAGTAGTAAPEVAYSIDLDVVAQSIGDNINANPNIKWSFQDTGWVDWNTMIAKIESYHEDVAANDLPDISKTGIQIAWKWAFDENDDADFEAGNTNEWDTAMGNAAALENVTLSIKLTATQVN